MALRRTDGTALQLARILALLLPLLLLLRAIWRTVAPMRPRLTGMDLRVAVRSSVVMSWSECCSSA